MYADSYGHNAGLPQNRINQYRNNLNTALSNHLGNSGISYDLVPHSELIAAYPDYENSIGALADSLTTQTGREERGITSRKFERLMDQAEHLSRGATPEKAAARYAAERILEADLIGNDPRLVKLSLVTPHHDALDLTLGGRKIPRAYVIPEYLRRPWMKVSR